MIKQVDFGQTINTEHNHDSNSSFTTLLWYKLIHFLDFAQIFYKSDMFLKNKQIKQVRS